MPALIRPALLDDYAALSIIADDVQEMHAVAVPSVFRSGNSALPHDYFAYLLKAGTSAVYVAERAGEIVGYLVLEIARSHVTDGITRHRAVHIEQIGVAREARGQGVGRALVETAVAWARGQEADELLLHVWEFNRGAIAFYEHLGLHTQSRTMSLPLTR